MINSLLDQLRCYVRSTLSVSFSTSDFYHCTPFGQTRVPTKLAQVEPLPPGEEISKSNLRSYLQRIVAAKNATTGTFATMGLLVDLVSTNSQVSDEEPSYRHGTYLHLYVGGASGSVDEDTTPQKVLQSNAEWIEEAKEKLGREWAPNMGSYMNEANPYNTEWKKDYYGEKYERLLEIKKKYDPHESLFILTGVGSDQWEYTCRVGNCAGPREGR